MAYETVMNWFRLWSTDDRNILSALSPPLQYVLKILPERDSLFPHPINLGWPCDLLHTIN